MAGHAGVACGVLGHGGTPALPCLPEGAAWPAVFAAPVAEARIPCQGAQGGLVQSRCVCIGQGCVQTPQLMGQSRAKRRQVRGMMRQCLANLDPDIGDAALQVMQRQLPSRVVVVLFHAIAPAGGHAVGAAAQLRGDDQQCEHCIGQAHHIGIVHQAQRVAQAVPRMDCLARSLDTLPDLALAGGGVVHGVGAGQCGGEAQQCVKHRQDFSAWARVALGRNQGQAQQAGKNAAKQELLAARKDAHGQRGVSSRLQARGDQYHIEQLGRQGGDIPPRFRQAGGRSSHQHDRQRGPWRGSHGRTQGAGRSAPDTHRAQRGQALAGSAAAVGQASPDRCGCCPQIPRLPGKPSHAGQGQERESVDQASL